MIIISVSWLWNRSHSSGFRRHAEIVLVSPSIFPRCGAARLVFLLWSPHGLVDLEFRSSWTCAFWDRFKSSPRVECASATTALVHGTSETVAIGISLVSFADEFELNCLRNLAIFAHYGLEKNGSTALRDLEIRMRVTLDLKRFLWENLTIRCFYCSLFRSVYSNTNLSHFKNWANYS